MKRMIRSLVLAALAAALGLLVAATASAGAAKQAAPKFKAPSFALQATLVIRSDDEHGKKGPDGKWHDAFLPANFTVLAGVPVKVTVYNYDDGAHSFTSSTLGVNQLIPGAKGGTPSKTTFTFTAKKSGKYLWWCNQPCDPWAMSHVGFMRGYVNVVA
jgi:uncharacterized cupredoxin-like copper-binding protein